MRGEYFTNRMPVFTRLELPPRARRILTQAIKQTGENGTTSACAENTPIRDVLIRVKRNYLRVRGEYTSLLDSTGIFGELPPRARRIQIVDELASVADGTTSACAENTICLCCCSLFRRNYLRVRGEYFGYGWVHGMCWELPPRARRIPPNPSVPVFAKGTTSACAENTLNELGLL